MGLAEITLLVPTKERYTDALAYVKQCDPKQLCLGRSGWQPSASFFNKHFDLFPLGVGKTELLPLIFPRSYPTNRSAFLRMQCKRVCTVAHINDIIE